MTDNDDTFYLYVRYLSAEHWLEIEFNDDFNRHVAAIDFLDSDYQVSFKGRKHNENI